MDAEAAAQALDISRAHLYRLRTLWLRDRDRFIPQLSGGNHQPDWSADVLSFLEAFLPLQRPPNYQLLADELDRRFGFQRNRKSIAQFVRVHFPLLVTAAGPKPQARRRWQRAQIGELWQHDSSIHQWWPAAEKQTLILTVDDHSRKLLGGTMVSSDTTWNHFEHFRARFLQHGIPLAIYTDGLALFGHDSTAEGRDPRSEFQRALTALAVTHLVAPGPEAKGKIERRFGTLQKRLVALLTYERVQDHAAAQPLVDAELARQNATVCRTTKLSPNDAWDLAHEQQRDALRPCPDPALLDLHLALFLSRRVNADHQIDFLGRSWPIAATNRATVTLVHHPERQFWVVTESPRKTENRWPEILGKFSL